MQWWDILGMLKVQAGKLDLGYFQPGVKLLRVTDMLDIAMREAE